jgi:hypothetical protein
MNSLSALEAQAETHLETWKQAYWDFASSLRDIRDSGAWEQSDCETWESYFATRWNPRIEVGYSRVRQLFAALPVKELVADVTGVSLNESQVRNIKAIVPDRDKHLIPEIMSETFAHTKTPAPRHIKAAYEVVKGREDTNTVVVDGENRKLNITSIAAKEAMVEADKRYTEYKTQGLIDAPVRIRVIDSVAYAVIQLPADYPVALLKDWIAKVPKPRIPAPVVSPSADSLEAVA